jgi:bifunctional DNA-binding transcriptional regulator/antitoxin component of YhaV-PrlF toxin-antitoxin module
LFDYFVSVFKGKYDMTKVIQLQQKGTLSIPVEFQQKYQMNVGDTVTLVDLGKGMFLIPKKSQLPKLVGEIERLREEAGISIDELIEGVRKQRPKKTNFNIKGAHQ